MIKLYYCEKCKRVLNKNEKCDFCGSEDVKELKVGKSVNVLGSKQKGKFLRVKGEIVSLIITDEMNNKLLKDYNYKELKKIL
ncbi:hypothetical protein ACER0A_004605 [Haloimpatiens sp. FM7315]|uniref:hypothetical protein n=1 Tax=Haloimpatiens sp. FM7315 TaxID=3298609 RepID=UPI0035A307BC